MPFSSNIHDFFTRHDDNQSHGFITRLDRSPIRQKKIVFFSALFSNILLTVCLGVLAAVTVQNCLQAPYPPSMRLAFALTQNAVLALAFIAILRSTVVPFILGECRLRYLYGFRESEPIIRRSPRSFDLRNLVVVKGDKKASEPHPDARIALLNTAQHLVDPRLLYYRPGALLSNHYWTPEYSVMLHAYKHLENGWLDELDFDFAVWKKEGGQWIPYDL
ncbi:hypothetical protein NMY22_g10976 [Coprinellus aureogranulatus]|nr:hypothetical protein NMY22_g10976 [Coprinellus aureogranulatus]